MGTVLHLAVAVLALGCGGESEEKSKDEVASGRALFIRNGCAVCHGESGRGDGQIAASLKRFPAGVYLSAFYLRGENSGVLMGLFSAVLQRFVRGRMHVHFETLEEARDGLQSKGFATVQIHAPGNLPSLADLGRRPGARRVRILEAWSGL